MPFAAPCPLLLALFLDVLQGCLQPVDAVACLPPVEFQFGFAGAPPADAAGQARHGRVFRNQPWQQVFQLGQLHLQAALTGLGALGKNVQD